MHALARLAREEFAERVLAIGGFGIRREHARQVFARRSKEQPARDIEFAGRLRPEPAFSEHVVPLPHVLVIELSLLA